jgi:isoquinoline 1-oxidoreductase beta subunit
MNTIQTDLSRRTFIRSLAAAGGGLVLGFHIPGARASITSAKPWTTPTEGAPEVNAWLTIATDGTVTIRVPHTEQGQGAMTSVASMVAEELDVPWKSVRAVFADMNRQINRGKEYKVTATAGSALVRTQHPHIMQAGASARERLKEAAAQAWGVDRSQVTAKQGVLTAGNKTGTYAEFATAAGKVTLKEEPKIKAYGPANWWLLGKDLPRLDVSVKVNGSAVFSIDIELDNMVYVAVKQTPVPWGRLVKYDASVVKGRPGVLDVVEFRAVDGKRGPNDLQDAIAVVADSWYRAKTAVDLIPVEWDFNGLDKVSDATQAAEARKLWDAGGGIVSKEVGADPRPIIAAAAPAKVVKAEYHRPFETHARMEPINATVSVTDKRIDVWSPMQDQVTPIEVVADQLKRDTKDIYTNPMFLGGAFGGNGGGNTAVTRQAAIISDKFKRPAKVIWTREEDINHDKQRPPHYTRLAAAIGDDGLPTAFFSNAVWYPFNGADRIGPASADVTISNMPYVIPSRRHEKFNQMGHIPTATHRGPGVNQNAFIMEQFADEMALAGGWDPLDWRIKLTEGQERWQRVLLKMKEVAGFRTDLPPGEGMGVAVAEDHGSICGSCAKVSIDRRGNLAIEKVVIVHNCGYVINPRAAAEQLKGAAIWELSHAVYGGLRLEGGKFVNTNFDSYNLMRINQVPEFEVHFALSQDGWWGGTGEPGGVTAPASVANAVFFATGKRIRQSPIAKNDLTPVQSG